MSALSAEELAGLREDGLSTERRRAFRAAASAARCFERAQAADIEAILHWIDELREIFGDPPVQRAPWRGNDFRL